MTDPVSLSTLIGLNPDVIVGRLGDEIAMLSIERGNYYGLNPCASRIWQLLETQTSIAAICAQLQLEYEVAPEQCESEVCGFISRMIEEGLVLIREKETVG